MSSFVERKRNSYPQQDIRPKARRLYRKLSQMAALSHLGIHYVSCGYSFKDLYFEVSGHAQEIVNRLVQKEFEQLLDIEIEKNIEWTNSLQRNDRQQLQMPPLSDQADA